MQKEKQLKDLDNFLQEPENAILSGKRLWELIKFDKRFNRLTQADILEKYNDTEIKQLHSTKKNKPIRHIVADFVNDEWNLDILDYQKYYTKNSHYKYILIGIDIYSRFGFAEALKDKTPDSVVKAFKKFLIYGKPSKILTDSGSDFKGSFFRFITEKDIELETVLSTTHRGLGIIDRFSRTIRENISKLWTLNGNHKWVDSLDLIVDTYNTSIHDYHNHRPIDVFNGKFEYNPNPGSLAKDYPIKLHDKVRIRLQKGNFDKKSGQRWSSQVYTVDGIGKYRFHLSNGEMYFPEDLQVVKKFSELPEKQQLLELEEKDVIIDRNVKKALKNLDNPEIIKDRLRERKQIVKEIDKKEDEDEEELIEELKIKHKPKEVNVYIMEDIVGHKKTKQGMLYLVKWQGYDSSQNTYEPEKNFIGTDSKRILASYKKLI